jgi:four helix bundle protein
MAEKEKPRDIRSRPFSYVLRASKLYQALQEQRNGAGWILGKQYLRSATSIGANIEETQSAESRSDFVHKYGIAQKEAKESLYWLRLVGESGILPANPLASITRETEELYAVVTAIIVSTKRNAACPLVLTRSRCRTRSSLRVCPLHFRP